MDSQALTRALMDQGFGVGKAPQVPGPLMLCVGVLCVDMLAWACGYFLAGRRPARATHAMRWRAGVGVTACWGRGPEPPMLCVGVLCIGVLGVGVGVRLFSCGPQARPSYQLDVGTKY